MTGKNYAAAVQAVASYKNGIEKLVGMNLMSGMKSMLQRRGLSVPNARTEVNE